MIFGKTNLEFKVGVFVFIGLIILAAFIFLIGDFKSWSSGYNVSFVYNFVNGVKVGAPIRFAGVDVGLIKKIKFVNLPGSAKQKVEIKGWVRKEVKIPIDSTVWINTLGLLGEKYIEIMPGIDNGRFVEDEQTIIGHEPIAMHEVVELAKKITTDIDESIVKIKNQEGTLGKLLYNDTIYNELEAMIIDIRKHPWKLFIKGKED